ncbi:MAG: hypothetical protein M0Z28_23365 [Rhodospirillales bacterium]|nr:hypothetical protein [Rhodospirillales bacterium]
MRRFAPFLVAFLFAVAMLPAGARAMPMRMGPMAAGAVMHQDCQGCPLTPSPGTDSGKMLPCPILACAGAGAVLPMPVLLPVRIALTTRFAPAPELRWAGAPRAPDPFPPRPVALV